MRLLKDAGVVTRAGFVGHLLGEDATEHDRVQAQRLDGGGIRAQLSETYGLGELRAHLLHLLHADGEGRRRGSEARHRAPGKQLRQRWILDRPPDPGTGPGPNARHGGRQRLGGSFSARRVGRGKVPVIVVFSVCGSE